MKTLIKKAFLDMVKAERRAVLSLIAIIIGMATFGVMLFSYVVIEREIESVYDATNPPSAVITIDNIDENLYKLTNDFGKIELYEERANYSMMIETSKDIWKNVFIFGIKDFDNEKINIVQGKEGKQQPGLKEALIETGAMNVADAGINSEVKIKDGNGNINTLTICGTANDLSVHPAFVHNCVYLYVSYDTLESMGLKANCVQYLVKGDPYNKENIQKISNEYIDMLQNNGYKVKQLSIEDNPGVSIHMDEYSVCLIILRVFAVISFLFGSIIMSNLISSILSSKIKQIGILKSIGARTSQIYSAYMSAFFMIILACVTISTVIVSINSKYIAVFLMKLGNMQPLNTSVPVYYYYIYIIFCIIVPIFIVVLPIRKGISITIKEALNNYNIGGNNNSNINIQFLNNKVSRPVLLSIRNMLRRKDRFLLNILTMTISCVLFISVVTMMFSVKKSVNNYMNTLGYDYEFVATANTDNNIQNALKSIEQVDSYENWELYSGRIINKNGQAGNSYKIIAPQDNSKMINPIILEGRWIKDSDNSKIVVSEEFLKKENKYKLGDKITIAFSNTNKEMEIVGVIQDFEAATIYINQSELNNYTINEERRTSNKLKLKPTSENNRKLYSNLELSIKENGVEILQSDTKDNMRSILNQHYTVTLQTILIVIIMLIIVSGFGLAATMNVQTEERTKEIGIMKAIGAKRKQIMKITVVESVVLSVISWVIAAVSGMFITYIGIKMFGAGILEMNLSMSATAYFIAIAICLILIIGVGYSASKGAAKRSAKLSIKEAFEI